MIRGITLTTFFGLFPLIISKSDYNISPYLAVARMMELVTGIPVKRVYTPDNDRQKDIAKYIEAVLAKNRAVTSDVSLSCIESISLR